MAVTQADVAKLYVATFNRAPDAAGLYYWTNNSDLSIEGIAQSFFDQPETQTLYPFGTDSYSFITSVYSNLFNRTPDHEGLEYWVNELDSGKISKHHFILAVINGAQNTDISQDITILTNKQTIGLNFVAQGLENVDFAKTVMENIDATNESVIDANTLISKVVAPTGDFTEERVIGLTLYQHDDHYSTFQNGHDALFSATFNNNGTITENNYTALLGSSTWTLEKSETRTWNIVNGHLEIHNIDRYSTSNSTMTLVSQTSTEMKFYDQYTKIYTNETSSTADDVTQSRSSFETTMLIQPSVRTEQMLLEMGLFKETFSGQVNFVDSTGRHAPVPEDAIVALTADRNYDQGRICFDINNDGSFSGTGFFKSDFSSSSLIEYYIAHDTDNNDIWNFGEECYSSPGEIIDFAGISTPFLVTIW